MTPSLRARTASSSLYRANGAADKPLDQFDLKITFNDNRPHLTCNECKAVGELAPHALQPRFVVRCRACSRNFSGSALRDLFDNDVNKSAIEAHCAKAPAPTKPIPTPEGANNEPPSTAVETITIHENELRDKINEYRENLVCTNCNKPGLLVLNGKSGNQHSQCTRCKVCHTPFSGARLRAILTRAIENSAGREDDLTSAPTPTPEGDQDIVALRKHNAQLLESNRSLREQNETLISKVDALTDQNLQLTAKVDKLTSKVEELLSKINKNSTSDADAEQPDTQESDGIDKLQPEQDPSGNKAQPDPINQPDNSETPSVPGDPGPTTSISRAGPRQPKLSWVDIAQKGIGSLPSGLQARLRSSMQSLGAAGFKARRPTPNPHANMPKPDPVPVYFGNAPRGPIGHFKRALFECLPKWAVLSVSFIGASTAEILCHKTLVPRLIATMRLLRYRHLPDYNPREARSGTPEDMARSYKAACYQRWHKLAASALSPACKSWYTSQAEALLASDNGLDEVPPPQRQGQHNKDTTDSDKPTVNEDNNDNGRQDEGDDSAVQQDPAGGVQSTANDDRVGEEDDDVVDFTDPAGENQPTEECPNNKAAGSSEPTAPAISK